MENHRSYPGVWGGEWKKNIVAQRSWPMENHQEFHGKDYSLPVIPIPWITVYGKSPIPFFPGSSSRLSQRSKRNQYLGEDAEHHRGPWGWLSWDGWCFLLLFFGFKDMIFFRFWKRKTTQSLNINHGRNRMTTETRQWECFALGGWDYDWIVFCVYIYIELRIY